MNSTLCRQLPNSYEDLEMGKCMKYTKAEFGDTKDELGRHRFIPVSIHEMVFPGKVGYDHWLWLYMKDRMDYGGRNCCSSEPISFHYVTPENMYLMDYLTD